MYSGFEPIFNENSKILILGSFPSVKSRKINFYYGNKQNKFWKMFEAIYDVSIGDTILSKTEFLLKNEIALWDIVKICDIEGSSDDKIRNIETVNLNVIFDISKIEKIVCNGKKSYEVLIKFYPNLKNITVCLPSTSPANSRFDLLAWEKELKNNTGNIII